MTDWADKDERVAQVEEWYNLAVTEDEEWRNRAMEAYDFYWGETWTPEELATLEERNAPALSINRVQPKVNMLSAIQRLSRYDINVKALVDKNDVPIAEILSHVIKHISEANNLDFLEAWQFLDGLITGRGYVAGDVSYENNMFGDVVFRYIIPFLVKFDPTGVLPDGSDWKFVMEERWFDTEDVLRIWKLDKKKGFERSLIMNPSSSSQMMRDDYFVSSSARSVLGQQKVVQCYHRRYVEKFLLVDIKTGDLYPLESEEEGKRAAAQQANRFYTIEQITPINQITTVCNGVELSHGDSPFSSTSYPIFPFFCLNAGGRQDGFVEAMKSPQLETNKRRSQMLHLVNQHGNTVWVVDSQAIANPGGLAWLIANANKPGLIIEKRPGLSVERKPPGDIPQGLVLLEQLASKDFFDVVGVNVETMPSSSMGSGASGKAVNLRQQQGMTLLSLPLDNQRLTRRAEGRWTLRTIQDFYTTERVFRIEGEDGSEEFTRINQMSGGTRLNDITLGKYDVVVSEEPISPTSRQAMFGAILESLHQGVPIPPDILIELSDIPKKNKIIQRMQQAQMAQGSQGSQGKQGSTGKSKTGAVAPAGGSNGGGEVSIPN
jgi:hypothetical protein